MNRIGWLDLSSGASGDMLLGALIGAGVDVDVITAAVAPLGLPIEFAVEPARRAGFAAARVRVRTAATDVPRTWRDVRVMLAALADDDVRQRAEAVFGRLAVAEAAAHGITADEVHFHEVGALDAIADVVGVCAGVAALELERLVAGPVALGGGEVTAAHGRMPVPGPAVLHLLAEAGMPTLGAADADVELCTPTGAALVTTLADSFGGLPPLAPSAVGVGAGGRDTAGRPNVVRLVLGTPTDTVASDPGPAADEPQAEPAVLIEANVDDLDPRVWPGVLAALLEAGAADAWLTPIVMKKGRPATTLSVLAAPDAVSALRDVVYRQTSTLGLRETPTTKRPLARDLRAVEIDGHRIAVKRGFTPDGSLVTAQPEWDDVATAALALGRPAREVLARASAAARALVER